MKGTTASAAANGRWQRLAWSLVAPRSRLSVQPTLTGTIVVALSLGLGVAAYNSANNILFITLSMLLACLIFSGVLSWLNLRGVIWRIRADPPWRAGQEGAITLSVVNGKRLLPTYGLWFDMKLTPVAGPAVPKHSSGSPSRDRRSVRERLAAMERSVLSGIVKLAGRLDPGTETCLDWTFLPEKRGRWRWELADVGTGYPFGFLRKRHAVGIERELRIWPATIPYQLEGAVGGWAAPSGERARRGGSGIDLLSLRAYAAGDSHRLIHWKASARQRQLLVRQHAAEQQEGFVLQFDPAGDRWPRAEQFERAVCFAATLAEDLFKAGRLRAVSLGNEIPAAIRRVTDLENWLDRLAVVEPEERPPSSGIAPETGHIARRTLQVLPDGAVCVAAFIHGRKAATA